MRTACSLSTGRVPGMPRSTRLAWVFGSAPKVVALPEKIFDWVLSWAWISSPITVSHCIVRVPQNPAGVQVCQSLTCWYWCATLSRRASWKYGAKSCTPTGRPSTKPAGMDRPGMPARLAVMV